MNERTLLRGHNRHLLIAVGLTLITTTSLATPPYAGGAVAAAHPLGSEAGLRMLEQGGNAVDAAVATAFTMAVVGPYHSGLGGGGMAVIHHEGQDYAFDFRERAPLAASRDMYVRDGKLNSMLSTDGPLAIATPGAIKGYLELHRRFGKLSRATVLAPAIHAARAGFVVTPKFVDSATRRLECLKADADAASIFLRDGRPPPVGARLKQLELAKTLETLARDGERAFYKGPLGKSVVANLKLKGGLIFEQDLEQYQTIWREPLQGKYRGHRIVTMPPPSAGGVALLQTLGIIEASGESGPASREVSAVHTFIEGLRVVYAERAQVLGDPAFVDVSAQELVSPPHFQELAARVNRNRAAPSLAPKAQSPQEGADSKHTSHISSIDSHGNAVSLTTTVNFFFGSCVVAKGTGILLNDQMDDFTGQPGAPNTFGLVTGETNAIAPKKTPLSSMTPTLVFMKEREHEVLLAVGAAGGPTIPTTVMQVISNVVDLNLDLSRAIAKGRIHHQWLPDEVWVDADGLEPLTWRALEGMGHHLKKHVPWGDAEAVMVDPSTGLKSAASDPRNEGAPSGELERRFLKSPGQIR